MMICTEMAYFTDLKMIRYYQKRWGWNSESPKTKNYATTYARHTTLKNCFLRFTLGHMTVMRISKMIVKFNYVL